MEISTSDKSNYFRGLLLLIRKDNKITVPEIELMRRVGTSMGFDKEFVEECIHNILDDVFTAVAPPKFSNSELAKKFIRDGLVLAVSDCEIHETEEEWLDKVVDQNDIDEAWYFQEKQNIVYNRDANIRLEAEKLTEP